MSIVTCDVVEAGAHASDSTFVSIDSLLATTGFGMAKLVWAIAALLTDASAHATDHVDLQPVALIVDTATARDAVIAQADLRTLVVERASAKDSAFNTPTTDVVESATAGSTAITARTTDVTESGTAAAFALFTASSTVNIVETAAAHDLLFGFTDYTTAEHATAGSSVVTFNISTTLLTDTVHASDTVLADGERDEVLFASATASSTITAQVTSTLLVTESAQARARALLTLYSFGWVMNSENFAMSRYTDLPAATLAVVAGRVLALGDTGLYELAGDTDEGAPIAASVTTGRLLLGSAYKKRVPDVFITGTSADAMTLTVGVYGEHKGSYSYQVPQRDAVSPRGHRVPLGKGLASTYWKFTLANQNGADFNLDTINADVAPSTTRRI